MLFRRTSCPVPSADTCSRCARPRHLAPLVGFLVPSVLIGYGIVLPRAGVSGLDELSLGFASTLLGATVTYLIGIKMALRS
jgi:hypothetical protein